MSSHTPQMHAPVGSIAEPNPKLSISELTQIRPKEKRRVYDLVREAGLETSDWANYKGQVAAANPKYCYEWVFFGPNQLIIFCLWYAELREHNGIIFQELNYRDYEIGSTIHHKKNVRARRAKKMDEAFKIAASNHLPIRVIVVDGIRRAKGQPTASKVKTRLLDPDPWHVGAYNQSTGACRLIRGPHSVKFADQFSLTDPSESQRRTVERDVFNRSEQVRVSVLQRSLGSCEYCGELGFLKSNGECYLETHHIVPLSKQGEDSQQNVIALCPNHHREAHHGLNATELQSNFIQIVSSKIAA